MLHSRTIRKITFGSSPLNQGLAFTIGGEFTHDNKRYRINSIEEDAQYFNEYGSMRYNVYLKTRGKNEEEFVWKSAINVPTTIEYFMPTDKDDVITVS
jgi:hypothetical protein